MNDRIRVLHVDDDPDLAALTGSFLERENDRITVETAPNATAGLDRLDAGGVDCVVSDHDMPGPNGIEVGLSVGVGVEERATDGEPLVVFRPADGA